MTMTMTRTECAQWLLAHDNYCILTHGGPDGDTLGSADGLCRGLRAAGKSAFLLQNEEIGPRLSYLCQDLMQAEVPENATVISVDVASPRMFPENAQPLLERIQLRIDHHGSGTSFAPLELVDPKSASCAEIIYGLLTEMGVSLTPEMATAIYTGTATDTGCFIFANTTANSHLVAARCMEAGAVVAPINQLLFDTVSLNRLKVQSWVTANTKFYEDGAVAVCALPVTLVDTLGVPEEEIGGVSGFVRSIEGVKMAATLREGSDGRVFISMRAVPGYDCAAVCSQFGGGGHKGAAGAGTDLPLAQITEKLTQAILEQFKKC